MFQWTFWIKADLITMENPKNNFNVMLISQLK